MLKNLDQEVKAEIEAVLKKDGFYSGEPEGYSAPTPGGARRLDEAKGPLPEAEIRREAAGGPPGASRCSGRYPEHGASTAPSTRSKRRNRTRSGPRRSP